MSDVSDDPSCELCGNCCRYLYFSFGNDLDADTVKMLGYRNAKYFPNLRVLRLPVSCIYLRDDNKCSIYNSRPNTCRSFPRGCDSASLKAMGCTDKEVK